MTWRKTTRYILIEQKSANIKSQECRQASISQNELKYWLRNEGRFTLSTELGRVFWLPRDRISGECILSLSKSIKLSLLSDCLAHESCCNNLVWNKRHVSFCSPVSDNYLALQFYQIWIGSTSSQAIWLPFKVPWLQYIKSILGKTIIILSATW